ncbi:MAG TPA: AMP-binding protein [Solirubrobacteraceae bacterium]|nr:AMP-binding protein [Solirubrobacteraceae bacterium]
MSEPIATGAAGDHVPTGAATLRAMLLEQPDRPALLDEAGRVRSRGELVARVDRLAGTLAEEGLAGEPVGVWYANSIAAFEAYLAVEWVGATRLVMDPATAPAEAEAMLDAAQARFALADRAHAALLRRPAIVHDDDSAPDGRPREPDSAVPPERPLHLYPRGVRTGELHAVPISYGNWAQTIALNCRLYRSGAYGAGWREHDETLLTLQQLPHGTALIGSFPFLWMGRPQVLVERFDPARVPELIERFAVTATGMTSGMLAALTRSLEDTGAPAAGRLRRLVYGGAPLSLEQMRRAHAALGPVLVQVYGRLEGGWPLAILGQRDHAAILDGEPGLAGSCGRPVGAPVELRLRPVAGGQEGVGELCTRSAMVVREYADPDGWCALGDLASLDADGCLHLRGRLDDMINTGYHVYPQQIEEALTAIPGVAAARVRGEPDERRGEAIVAYVVPAAARAGERLGGEALRARLRETLAPYKIPHRIELVATLPDRAPASG